MEHIDIIQQYFVQQQITLAVAESITTGNLQAQLGSIAGASAFFVGGITAYQLEQKVKHLGIDTQHAQSVDSVSQTVANQMAKGVTDLFGSTIGCSTTGYADSLPEKNIIVPFAYISIYDARTNQYLTEQKVSGQPTMTRIDMQYHVTYTVIEQLAKLYH